MSANSADLRVKECGCGGTMEQIIGFSEPDEYRPERYPIRQGWYCFDCHRYEIAMLREKVVIHNHW